ncbi:hypothetical protein Nepgr_033419 [Nepenthes gracilis]|uniref:Uncharacterized protein n=1 Tax=Nepenthes gracilis TaxID=150966 RepID=A0AAD3Y8D1_NEPGR|nr:hypothetical protein Nepgr_033419 [Nepenthes gracilis]
MYVRVELLLHKCKLSGLTNVADNCKVSLLEESNCKRCINASSMYPHHIIEAEDNETPNTCRDATLVALASQADNVSPAVEFASSFIGAPGLSTAVSMTSSSATSPNNSPSSPVMFAILRASADFH